MDKPRFRNPQHYQLLKNREWIRRNLPPGKTEDFKGTGETGGFIAEDLDLVLKIWSMKNTYGKFMLVEIKHEDRKNGYMARLGKSKQETFGLIDYLLRRADPNRETYMGYYVVHQVNEDWNKCECLRINYKHELPLEEVKKWMLFELDIEPYKFPMFGRRIA